MGNYFYNKSNHESDTTKLPQMNVSSQMECILIYWIRKTDKRLTGTIPIEIIHLIIHKFAYQKVFESENKIKLEYPEHYKRTKTKPMPDPERDYDFLFKLVLIGDSGVGKTSLLYQYCGPEDCLRWHRRQTSTIGVDFQIKTIDLNGKRIKLQIWDTAGQERFRTITPSYYRGAHGILLVYDIANTQSFQNIKKWNGEIDKYASERVLRILIGNKSDLRDTHSNGEFVSKQDGENMAEALNIEGMIQTCAKNGNGVNDAFESIVGMILGIVVHRDRRIIQPFYG
eukprot:249615_1